jgi:hypothetical protein
MKTIMLFAAATPLLLGCATNVPVTSWGKEGVSMHDYRFDGAHCAALAATATPESNGANAAGGINGKNTNSSGLPQVPTGQGAGRATGAAVSTGSSPYRDGASTDFAQRAATQQRTQEMMVQRMRAEKLKSCLYERGYTEFELTPEQRMELAKLPQSSEARREYLYKLGTDPEILKQAHKPVTY